MAAMIELFPKRQLTNVFTQSTYEAVDAGGYQLATLQVTVDGLVAGDIVDVLVEESDFNDDAQYVPSVNPVVNFPGTPGTQVVSIQIDRRFVRLNVTPTLGGPNNAPSVRAELMLRDE